MPAASCGGADVIGAVGEVTTIERSRLSVGDLEIRLVHRVMDPEVGISVLPKDHQTLVMTAKRILWEKTGMLTHADVGFIARKLITGQQKSLLTRILRTRFPFLVVDELQDTGYCQGHILHALIDNDIGSALLVGDPDQAIYAFNGARPDLFDSYARISGMKALPLSGSRRCPQAVLHVANQLKDTPGEVSPENTNQGQAHFLIIDDPASDVRRLFDALSATVPGKTVSVVTRTTRQRAILLRQTEAKFYKLHAPALSYLFSAVCAFRRGENRASSGLVRAALDLALFDHEGASDSQLADIGLDIDSYQLLISRCLISCAKIPDSLTLYQWQKQSALVLKELLAPYSTPDSLKYREGKVGPKQVTGHDIISSDLLPAQ